MDTLLQEIGGRLPRGGYPAGVSRQNNKHARTRLLYANYRQPSVKHVMTNPDGRPRVWRNAAPPLDGAAWAEFARADTRPYGGLRKQVGQHSTEGIRVTLAQLERDPGYYIQYGQYYYK